MSPLSPTDKLSIHLIHADVNRLPFNNMCYFLDWMGAIRETSSQSSIKESLRDFAPNLSQLVEKYQSGNCLMLSNHFKQLCHPYPVTVEIVGKKGSTTIYKPRRDVEINISSFSQANNISGYNHFACTLRFVENGSDQGLFLDMAQGTNSLILEKSWSDIEPLLTLNKFSAEPISEPEAVVKELIRTRTRYQIMGPNPNALLGLDLIRGELYLNNEGATLAKGCPTNCQGRSVIKLRWLTQTQAKKTLLINGAAQNLTPDEALLAFYTSSKRHFRLPPDFIDNIKTLASVIDQLKTEVFTQPIQDMMDLSLLIESNSMEEYNSIIDELIHDPRFQNLIYSSFSLEYDATFQGYQKDLRDLYLAIKKDAENLDFEGAKLKAQQLPVLAQQLCFYLKQQLWEHSIQYTIERSSPLEDIE